MMKVKKAVIPCAGLGTRMRPITNYFSKEALPLNLKPAIWWILDECKNAGIEEVALIISKKKENIKTIVDSYAKILNIDVTYIYQLEMLGSGHAIKLAEKWVGNHPFALLWPDDIMTKPDKALPTIIKVYEKTKCSVIGAMPITDDEVSKQGVIEKAEEKKGYFLIRTMIEKPELHETNSRLGTAGRYVFTPEIFKCLAKTKPDKKGEYNITDAIILLGEYCGVDGIGTFMDIGSAKGYAIANYKLTK